MNLKDFIQQTVNDTIEFIKVHIRMLEILRDKTENVHRKEGIQDCIDVLENSCDKGLETADFFAEKRERQLNELLMEEFCAAPVEACGKDKDKN